MNEGDHGKERNEENVEFVVHCMLGKPGVEMPRSLARMGNELDQ